MSKVDLDEQVYLWRGRELRYPELVFGVEIEVEGSNLPTIMEEMCDEDGNEMEREVPELGNWDTHEEGSVQGAEYVMQLPLPYRDTILEIHDLFTRLDREYHATLVASPRTSVHVHVNCQYRTARWLIHALPILAAAEPFLIHHSGRHRKGNLFCLSREEAPFGWIPFIHSLQGRETIGVDTKYSAINFIPLLSWGTIEFRMMRGLTDPESVCAWLRLLNTLFLAIDDIPEDYDWQKFPPQLEFLAEDFGLAQMPPAIADRLRLRGLRSAVEVSAALTNQESTEENKPVFSPSSNQSPSWSNIQTLSPTSLAATYTPLIAHESLWFNPPNAAGLSYDDDPIEAFIAQHMPTNTEEGN